MEKKTKEALNILNHAVEYYDMLWASGDKEYDQEAKKKVWEALNHVQDQLWKENGKHE